MIKKHTPVFILSVLLLSCVIVCCLLLYENRQTTQKLDEYYLLCSTSAQQNLNSCLSGDSYAYDYLTSDIYALTVLGTMYEDNSEIRELNNELEKCHALLITRSEDAKKHLDVLNEALLLYINDNNIVGCKLKLQAFYNVLDP